MFVLHMWSDERNYDERNNESSGYDLEIVFVQVKDLLYPW
jgi:hypothetical protein